MEHRKGGRSIKFDGFVLIPESQHSQDLLHFELRFVFRIRGEKPFELLLGRFAITTGGIRQRGRIKRITISRELS